MSGLSKSDALAVIAILVKEGVAAELVEGPPGEFTVRTSAATGGGPSAGSGPSSAGGGASAGNGSGSGVGSGQLPAGALVLGVEHLRAMFARCAYDFPETEMVLFGIRGALPADADDVSFGPSKVLLPTKIDYRSMACTLGQWTPENGIAVFPGSTVPNQHYIDAAAARMGEGANVLARCKVSYTRGVHKQGTPTAHQAFRQDGYFPGTRSRDSVVGDDDDYFDTRGTIFWDDLHAAWSSGPSKDSYSSAGCQVVAGIPSSPKTGGRPDSGPWATFRANAYARKGQSRYVYALFSAGDLARVNGSDPAARSEISLRFGSEGDVVVAVQQKLAEAGYDPGPANGQFGRRTLQAVLAFQLHSMGAAGVDGVVGGQTFSALGMPGTRRGGVGLPASDDHFEASAGDEPRASGTLGDVDEKAADASRLAIRQTGNRWSGEVDGKAFPIGTRTRFSSGGTERIGLYQSAADLGGLTGGTYDPARYRAAHGGLADLLVPTAMAESRLMFSRLNTYDRAAFTFGFLQFAAHTPRDNLVLLLRTLVARSDRAAYFPDLTIGGGLLRDATGRNLEEPDPVTGELTRLMRFLKPADDRVTDEEARAAGRLMLWTDTEDEVRDAQVEVGAAIFRHRWTYFSGKYGVDLDRLPREVRAPVFVWAMDIRHQGRGTYREMAQAINGGDPVRTLAAIGAGTAGPARIDTVRRAVERLPEIDWSWLR